MLRPFSHELVRRQFPIAVFVQRLECGWRVRDFIGVNHAVMIRIQRAVMSCTQSMSSRYPERGYLMVNVTPECQIPTMIWVLGAVDH